MKIVLLGAPGAGKGTQAKKISSEFGLEHISTGDLLRASVSEGTESGKTASDYMNQGKLVPDHVVLSIMKERLAKLEKGYILDGFPRTINQAQELSKIIKLDSVINIDVNFNVLLKRLTGRRSCKNCGAVFHKIFNPPKTEGKCSECGSELVQRDDDNEKTVTKRINTYVKTTQSLIEYYREKGLLKEVNGNGKIDSIFQEISSYLGT